MEFGYSQMRMNSLKNLILLDWFRNVIDSPCLKSLHLFRGIGKRSHKDNGNSLCLIAFFQASAGFQTIDTGHHDIHQYDIWNYMLNLFNSRFTCLCYQQSKIGFTQKI